MASTPTQTKIKSYPLTGSNSEKILTTTLNLLKPNLPTSIPLYRRLQFGRFFDATCLLSNLPLDSAIPFSDSSTTPWIIAFVDRSCRPETEVWVSASWEVGSPSDLTDKEQSTVDSLVRELVLSMKSLPIPSSIHEVDFQTGNDTAGTDHAGLSLKDYGGHAADPNIMLWGGVHERTVTIMQNLGLLSFQYKRILQPNYTFIFSVDSLPQPRSLPEGLRWGELKVQHFPLVRSRTQIPRQDRTLAILPNLGIFPTEGDEPIAWAFVGLDASLTTLHVEKEWRGKGLAKALTTKLFKEKMDVFWEKDVRRWAHGYVIAGNGESEGMCRSLGGVSEWDVYWLRVDLGLV